MNDNFYRYSFIPILAIEARSYIIIIMSIYIKDIKKGCKAFIY
jgi:hypothetical protein